VRILLDECLPKRLKRDLVGHEAQTVPEMGWASKTNGELLALAESGFDVFLTVDRNLSFQQEITRFNVAVVVLVAKGNRYCARPAGARRGLSRGAQGRAVLGAPISPVA
jgi:predicted nuclease of predicted toxin-antitoxin system